MQNEIKGLTLTKPTFNKVASALSKAEGLKHQSTIGDTAPASNKVARA